MLLFHMTHRARVNRIMLCGLDPDKSKGKRKVIWLAQHCKLEWLRNHLCFLRPSYATHGVLLELQVPSLQVFAYRPGIWYSRTIINPDCVRAVYL